MHGEGHLQYGETDRLDEYRGQFHMGTRHGKGTLTWSDGRRYTGAEGAGGAVVICSLIRMVV